MATVPSPVVPKLTRGELDVILASLAAYRQVKRRAVNTESNPDVVAIRKNELAAVDALAARLMSVEFTF